jgi:hypothetical protein
MTSTSTPLDPAVGADIDWEGPDAPLPPGVAAEAAAALASAASSLPVLPPIGLPGLGLPGLPSFDFGALLALPDLSVGELASSVSARLLEALVEIARDVGNDLALDLDVEAQWTPESLTAELLRAAGALGAEARRLVSRAVAEATAAAALPEAIPPLIAPVGLPSIGLPSLPSFAGLVSALPRLPRPPLAELEQRAAEELSAALRGLELDLDLEAAGSLTELRRLSERAASLLEGAQARALARQVAQILAKAVPAAVPAPVLPPIGLPGLGLPGLPTFNFDLSL